MLRVGSLVNKRMLLIVRELAEGEKPQTLASLAERHGVSQRTIRNDLNTINGLLDAHGVDLIALGAEGAVLVPEGFKQSSRLATRAGIGAYRLSKHERQVLVAALLVNAVPSTTLGAIATALAVSRSTIVADLEQVKGLVAESDLQVVSLSGSGLWVEGDEYAKRAFLLKLAQREFSEEPLSLFGEMVGIDSADANALRKIINEQEHACGLSLSDESFEGLRRYLAISSGRRRQGVEATPSEQEHSVQVSAFAQQVNAHVEQYGQLTHSDAEASRLAQFMAGLHYLERGNFTAKGMRIQMLTRTFIRDVSEDLGIDLNADFTLFDMLSNHLESMLSIDVSTLTPDVAVRLLADGHPEIRAAVMRHLSAFDGYGGRPIVDMDVDFIVVHVCAAIERRRNGGEGLVVAVVCHAGLATSRLLMERLRGRFSFRISEVLSAHEAESLSPERADLVISTVPLSDCPIEYVMVSPIMTEDDYARVGNKVEAIRSRSLAPQRMDSAAQRMLDRIADGLCQLVPDQADDLMALVRRELRSYLAETGGDAESLRAPDLYELLDPSQIMLDLDCDSWREAIALSAAPLLEGQLITSDYVDAMIANTEENGPYYLLAKGFAMPHAGIGEGSVKLGMSLARLSKPVAFGSEELDPVEFVCILSPVDHDSHLRAFFHLMALLTNTDLLDRLRVAKTPAEVTATIRELERTLEG